MTLRSGPQVGLRAADLFAAMSARDRARVQESLASLNEVVERPINAKIAALLDDPAAARAELRHALDNSAGEPEFTVFTIATWAAYYDDSAMAIEALRGVQNRRLIGGLIWTPLMRDVRRTPAFKGLMSEAGFVAYWRESHWNEFCQPVGDPDFACK